MRLLPHLPLVILLAAGARPLSAATATVSEETPVAAAPAVEVHGVADARLVAAGKHRGWLDGGFARSRWGGADSDRDGRGDRAATSFRPGQLSLVVSARAAENLRGHLQVNLDADPDRGDRLGEVGLVEGFLAWSPVLGERARFRLRGGVWIPPFSLEHPGTAWSTRYTITPSAIGSWLGEEVKSTGAEGTLSLDLGGSGELQLQAALFTGNDSTGALLAWRGWALHDRQGMVGDELPLPAVLSLTDPRFFPNQGLRTRPFREIDGQLGWHAQARLRLDAHFMVQGGWYDNFGDVESTEPGGYTWDTNFGLAGVEIAFGRLTLLGQYLAGRARMGFETPALVEAPFRAGFALASVETWPHSRISARYDRFEVEDDDPWQAGKDLNVDDGWAATVAVVQGFGEHHALWLEYLHIDAEHPFAATAGEEVEFRHGQFQAAWRLSF